MKSSRLHGTHYLKGKNKMNENKKEFIAALETALRMDSRSGVEYIKYATDIWFEDVRYAEVVTIYFKGGAYKLINVTANSNGENAKQIIKAVYSSEPVGLIFYGFEEECDD